MGRVVLKLGGLMTGITKTGHALLKQAFPLRLVRCMATQAHASGNGHMNVLLLVEHPPVMAIVAYLVRLEKTL
jgi:hypothetical protein